jgi:hypothetical protein
MRFKILVTGLLVAFLATSCGSPTPPAVNKEVKASAVASIGSTENQNQAIKNYVEGKAAGTVITPALFLDLSKDKLPAEATAKKDYIFVLTIRSVDAGTLSYIDNPSASIKVNALSYGSIAYKFPKTGSYDVVYTTESGVKTTIATINAV